MTNTINLDLDVDLSPGDVAERLIMLPWLDVKMELVDDEKEGHPRYHMGNADIDVISKPPRCTGQGESYVLSNEAVGVHVPRRAQLSFTSRKSTWEGYEKNGDAAYAVLDWLIRHVPGSYFMAHESGSPYACHADGQTWLFVDDPEAANAEPDRPHPRLTVPYRYRSPDRLPPDPLPPLRNVGRASPAS